MTVPFSVMDKFHSLLCDDDQFNEAVMRVALETVSYYAGGEALTDKDYELAYELCSRVTAA